MLQKSGEILSPCHDRKDVLFNHEDIISANLDFPGNKGNSRNVTATFWGPKTHLLGRELI